MRESELTERGWHYVIEPQETRNSGVKCITAGDGRLLTMKKHGSCGRILVEAPPDYPWALLLRACAALGEFLETRSPDASLRVRIVDEKIQHVWNEDQVQFSGPELLSLNSRHPLNRTIEELGAEFKEVPPEKNISISSSGRCRILFFESLMNSDMEHNSAEISQGVLHMVSALSGTSADPVFAQVKMPIEGDVRPIEGLESLDQALSEPLNLVCITLLEGYWEGVVRLVRTLRERGCRARIAVGGVMPTLSPEHVAAHLDGVSFICRGAGEPFLPRLAEILGDSDLDSPLNAAQKSALLGMDGLIVLEQSQSMRTLISCRSDRVVKVPDLDRVSLDLSYVQKRHLIHGVEICTSRGCIHRCSFCGIMGRESYQARSSGSIIGLLNSYADRYRELWGDSIPHTAWRLHIADDDFACERDRARQFFEDVLKTPFRLSSAQVSVADLCLKKEGKLLPELDRSLCDSIIPDCFADHHKDIPPELFLRDENRKGWSSYLQIGVETFCDAELIRLGKGYRLEHVRTVVSGMAAKKIHVDAYFIQSNSRTTAEELVDSAEEICRLKLAHPYFFHVRFPAVAHLVSYFPSASHRRQVRQGRSHVQVLRGQAKVPGHNEYDYPFVDHDIPVDALVEAAVKGSFFTAGDCYTRSLSNLRKIWSEVHRTMEGEEADRVNMLIRRLDDLPRRLIFNQLKKTRDDLRMGENQELKAAERLSLTLSEEILGKSDVWKLPLQRWVSEAAPRLVLIPTWQCELRCRYCVIPKQAGRVMSLETARDGIRFLLSSSRKELILQFFGGEALLEWELVRESIRYGHEQALKLGKDLRFILSSNGMSIDSDRLKWLADYPVKLELSLDGDSDTQNRFRRALKKGEDSYAEGIGPKSSMIQGAGLPYDVIMVVHPENAFKMAHNFKHIASQGWRRIQINYGLGVMWTREQKEIFAAQLMKVGAFLRERWDKGDNLSLINLESVPMPMRLNGEITVDYDGSIHGGNAFLQRGETVEALHMGHLSDLSNFDRHWLDMPENDVLLDNTHPPKITLNNIEVGKIFASFIRWMRAKGLYSADSEEMESVHG